MTQGSSIRPVLLLLLLGSCLVVAPLWAALTLSIWFAALARPLQLRLARLFRGSHRAAAVLTMTMVMVLVIPLVLSLVSLGIGAVHFAQRMIESQDGRKALASIVSENVMDFDLRTLLAPGKILPLLQEYGARVLKVTQAVAGATVQAFLSLFIFVLGGYTFLVDGPSAYRWAERHVPLPAEHFQRLGSAFLETGRGLIVGIGLTALIQGVLATVAYAALRIPSALTLGVLTALSAVIPSFGTALIWVPVSIGLAITGRWVAALVLFGLGVLVISTVDNLLRPFLARYGNLTLPTFALFVGIFGGLAAFGTWGFILGPLILRLTMEVLVIDKEESPKEAA